MMEYRDVEDALTYLAESIPNLVAAVHDARRAENMIGHVRAIEMKKNSALPLAAQEREAKASEAYLNAIYQDAIAAGALAKARAHREVALMKIEIWRTLQANDRAAMR